MALFSTAIQQRGTYMRGWAGGGGGGGGGS